MSTETSGFVPIRDRIADSIRAAIRSGELAPGASLPSLSAISKEWEVAKATAEAALAVLREEGLVIAGGRGRPAQVRRPPERIKLPAGMGQAMKDLVRLPEAERAQNGALEMTTGASVRDVEFAAVYTEAQASDELAQDFGIDAGAPLVRREYSMVDKQTGIYTSWSVSYIPRVLIESNPDLLDDRNEPWPGGHQHQLYTVGIELDRLETSVWSVTPTATERQQWGLDEGVPLLRGRTKSIDINGRTVEISEAVYPADRTEVCFVEHLERW
ncbi:GntR family transcriptional regulator [Saccharopolyspora antimicrobica]|uniref:GntR family transcriptional regulator n=1 Tax=Saccharopolyspora antimicrobica TaxID=455193 RepID=A0A1I5ISL7_9PSEU|nr:GntR family transcriptional regulator [Saccharopolyspora antimicrobica]RKT84158.1 GntR family transcriptional regulator [Saccharopolyspora antimicrobica]SFO63497.1 GntR family transcriptional regulator [Saccharopolyspora antimicrobica]